MGASCILDSDNIIIQLPARYPGGESVGELESRVDLIIGKVRAYHRKYFEEGTVSRDVMIVAHGHFGRVLTARWVGLPLAYGRASIAN